jgi:hypothetical protein
MRWAGNVARVEVKRSAYEVFVGISKGKRPLGIDERIILKQILKKLDEDCAVDSFC